MNHAWDFKPIFDNWDVLADGLKGTLALFAVCSVLGLTGGLFVGMARYAHNRANLVAGGETVKKNQAVALLGATGRTTGPHVHFEVVHNGDRVNPLSFVGALSKLHVEAGTTLRR